MITNKDEIDLVADLIPLLESSNIDMTIFFRLLSNLEAPDVELLNFAFYSPEKIPVEKWNEWLNRWWGVRRAHQIEGK